MDGKARIARRHFLALAGAGGVAAAAGATAFYAMRADRAHAPGARPDGLAAAEARQAAQRASLCSSANVAGVGLRGEYFAAERCAGAPMLVRLDAAVDFDASLDWPGQEQPQRPRSVRWSGWVKPPVTGRYRFHGAGDARIAVSRLPMAGAGAPSDAHIELAAGRFYPIVMELDRLALAEGRIRLEWTAPHGARFVVPRALLYLPTEGLQPSRVA